MSCKICGRGACASWMHSMKEQERFEEREKMTDNVSILRETIQELRDENEELRQQIVKMEEGDK